MFLSFSLIGWLPVLEKIIAVLVGGIYWEKIQVKSLGVLNRKIETISGVGVEF